MKSKFIFITGGVLSSLGKGIVAASLGLLLEGKGLKIALMKLDPYLNVDPGTMNPFQHGEIYVTDDGAETDLDLGHYYRFTNSPLSKISNSTSGQIYDEVLKKERAGEYLGKTVQVIPHITDVIKNRIIACSNQKSDIDVTIIEIGGTVGDIESQPFLEAIRQFRHEHLGDSINIHLTYVPYIEHADEVKTKPTQHSVQQLQRSGIFPDMILCRCKESLSKEIKEKISLFCSVPIERVIDVIDVKNTVYEVPILLQKAGFDISISELLDIKKQKSNLQKLEKFVADLISTKKTINIGFIGKYLQHKDAYKSIFESLTHAGIVNGVLINIIGIDSEKITDEDNFSKAVSQCHGILVPGGFGERGLEGKVTAAKFCREHNVPYFGICLGMQVMVIEFARNVLNLHKANTTEIDPLTKYKVISLLSEQKNVKNIGGSMRLGAYKCNIDVSSLSYKAYGKHQISERHRHRYEFNNEYKKLYEEHGLKVVGTNNDNNEELCEIIENINHQWMVGVQFHPEFKSKPTDPHPLFISFIKAIVSNEKKNCRRD